MKDKEKVHNGDIALWKFIYCLMIIIYHVSNSKILEVKYEFKYGAIGVEFFFLVSGYLMAKKALNFELKEKIEIGKETIKYLFNKIKRIYPYILLSYIISLPVLTIVKNFSKSDIVNSVWDLLIMQSNGIYKTHTVIVAWYISAMLISMLILFPLILKYKKNYIYIIAPIIVFFGWGYIIKKYNNFPNPWIWNGFTTIGVIRATFELSLGSIIYCLSEKLKQINFTKFAKILLTIIEIVGFCSILFIVNINEANTKYDSVMLLIIATSITIAFSQQTVLLNHLNNKFVYFLERLSLPLYINQIWIIELLKYLLDKFTILSKSFYLFCIIVIVIDLVISILDILCVKYSKKGFTYIKKKLIQT